jgi:hypothetical protein
MRSRERTMSVAAGFKYWNGIVLCADTLVSGGIVSRHASKIGGFRFSDGVAVFAVAGHSDMAEAAIQQCEEPLCDYSGEPRKKASISRIIREVLAREYEHFIIKNGYENTAKDYAIIVAIHSESDGVGLYATAGQQMKRSKGCELIGSGEAHALLAMERFGGYSGAKNSNANRASLIAAYVVGNAKRYQQDSVGGNSVIIHLESSGMVSAAYGCNDSLIEKYAEKFHTSCDVLMSSFLDLARGTQFDIDVEGFPNGIRNIREQYKNENDNTFSILPIETSETLWNINPPEYFEKIRSKRLNSTA